MSGPQGNPSEEQQAEHKHQAQAKRRYVALQFRGAGPKCIAEPGEASLMMIEDPGLTATDTWMTVAEFEALPDFGGF